jgi:hypothetical protein
MRHDPLRTLIVTGIAEPHVDADGLSWREKEWTTRGLKAVESHNVSLESEEGIRFPGEPTRYSFALLVNRKVCFVTNSEQSPDRSSLIREGVVEP